MSYELSWYLPKRIIHIHILGEMELSEVEAMSHAAFALMEEGIAPVHILMDDAKGGRPPLSLKELKSRLEITQHASIGWIVGIGDADPVAKFLIPLLMKLVKLQYVRVKTIEEALEVLRKQDMSLQELSLKS